MAPTFLKPPTVRVDGDKIRLLREGKGLTQLYVAEVAKVSVDTVSRWENNRTPAVKRENAEALAQALEVELEEILQEDAPAEAEAAPPPSVRRPPRWSLWAGLALVLILGAWYGWRLASPPAVVLAVRRLPPYTPPGSVVPVLVRVRQVSGTGHRVVVREKLPAGWKLLRATPKPDQGPSADGTVKWIMELKGGDAQVGYLAQAPADGREGQTSRFEGEVITAAGDAKGTPIRGETRIDLEYVYWADQNGDFQISDAEVLDALERLEALADLGVNTDDLRRLWGAPEYEWDRKSGGFRPL
jgi:transcriptional regulator with XRE-family HTH domain